MVVVIEAYVDETQGSDLWKKIFQIASNARMLMGAYDGYVVLIIETRKLFFQCC